MHAPTAKKGKKSATSGEATKAKDSKQAADDRKQQKEVCARESQSVLSVL